MTRATQKSYCKTDQGYRLLIGIWHIEGKREVIAITHCVIYLLRCAGGRKIAAATRRAPLVAESLEGTTRLALRFGPRCDTGYLAKSVTSANEPVLTNNA